MKLIDVIDYNHPYATGLNEPAQKFARERAAARAVVTDDAGAVYMLHVSTEGGYFKIPGGGIDEGEDIESALRREVLEEIGYEVEIGESIGQIIQYDAVDGFRQDSYCYHARVTGGSGKPDFTDSEKERGFSVRKFNSIDEAIAAITAVKDPGDHVHAIQRRELAYLRAAKN